MVYTYSNSIQNDRLYSTYKKEYRGRTYTVVHNHGDEKVNPTFTVVAKIKKDGRPHYGVTFNTVEEIMDKYTGLFDLADAIEENIRMLSFLEEVGGNA